MRGVQDLLQPQCGCNVAPSQRGAHKMRGVQDLLRWFYCIYWRKFPVFVVAAMQLQQKKRVVFMQLSFYLNY
jgi:hypothetical protein